MHYFSEKNFSVEWHSPLPRHYLHWGEGPSPQAQTPLGAYSASTPRLRRGLNAFGMEVEVSAPSAPRCRPPHYFFPNSTTVANHTHLIYILYIEFFYYFKNYSSLAFVKI